MSSVNRQINEAIVAANQGDYLRALTTFLDVYGGDEHPPLVGTKAAAGLSYFGLTLALVQKKYKNAIELCKRAIELEFYNADHYVNLTRVYLAAGNRKKALETVQTGMKLIPEHDGLIAVRREVGVRARPAVPFLDRKNPINVTLGQKRHAAEVAAKEKKKTPR